MNELEEKLDALFLEIMNEATTPKKVKAMLDEMTLSYDDVVNTIMPFIEWLEETRMGFIKLGGQASSFFYMGKIIDTFIKHCFNQITEDGYLKNTKIPFAETWLCGKCNKVFYITEKITKKKSIKPICLYCNSSQPVPMYNKTDIY